MKTCDKYITSGQWEHRTEGSVAGGGWCFREEILQENERKSDLLKNVSHAEGLLHKTRM